MAGRNRYTHEAYDNWHEYLPGGPSSRGSMAMPRPMLSPPHPSRLEEELEIQCFEKLRLLDANGRLLAHKIALQQELDAAREKLRRMTIAITDIKAENETRSRRLMENVLKVDADLCAIEPLKKEGAQLHVKVKGLNSARRDLSWQVQILKEDISRLKADNKQLPALRAEYHGLRKELMHVRACIDKEKKRGIELMEGRRAMEKNLVSMALEVEKLRAELKNNDVGPSCAGGSSEMKFGISHCSKMNNKKHDDSARDEIKQAIVDEKSVSQDRKRRKINVSDTKTEKSTTTDHVMVSSNANPPKDEEVTNSSVRGCDKEIQGSCVSPDSPKVKDGPSWNDEFVDERVDPKYRKSNGWLSCDDDSEEENYSELDVDKVHAEVKPKIDHNGPRSKDCDPLGMTKGTQGSFKG